MRALQFIAGMSVALLACAFVVIVILSASELKSRLRSIQTEEAPTKSSNSPVQREIETAFDRNVVALIEARYGKLPARINDELELTRINTIDRIVSFYLRVKIDITDVNRQSVKALRPQLERQFCRDKAIHLLSTIDVKVTFVMTDLRNRVLYRFFMDPEDCG
ncbi:MAG: hypothetical protein AAF526_12615 [Pseudomonadota bacterium]